MQILLLFPVCIPSAEALDRAAKLFGMPLESFMELLGSQGIAVIDYDPGDHEAELKVLEKYDSDSGFIFVEDICEIT